MLNTLIEEAGPDTTYTRPEIQAAFERELQKYPHLKDSIKTLLESPAPKTDGTTPVKETARKPFDLSGWAMEAIRAGLGKLAKTTPEPK